MIEERIVTVEEVNHPYAVVRDQRGATFEVPTSILPVRGQTPRAGEQWVVTRDLFTRWSFVGYIDATGQGGASFREALGDGVETTFLVTHGLGTLSVVVQAFEEVGGQWVVQQDATLAVVDTTTVNVTFATPPPVLGGAVVVLSV